MDVLCFWGFLSFESKSPFTASVWEITAMPFQCETPATFCGLKIFTQPSIGIRVSKQ